MRFETSIWFKGGSMCYDTQTREGSGVRGRTEQVAIPSTVKLPFPRSTYTSAMREQAQYWGRTAVALKGCLFKVKR